MCNGVRPDDGKKKCVVCGERIDKDALRCNNCKMYQQLKNCSVCNVLIPARALRCNDCQSFQGWRSALPSNQVVLALLVSLVTVLTGGIPLASNFFARGSQTTMVFKNLAQDKPLINNDKLLLVVKVRNYGGTLSRVDSAELDLSPLKLGTIKLSLANREDQDVAANGQTELKLYAPQILGSDKGEKTRKALIELPDLCTTKLPLKVTVYETNIWGRFRKEPVDLSDNLEGHQLIDWLWERYLGTTEPPPCV